MNWYHRVKGLLSGTSGCKWGSQPGNALHRVALNRVIFALWPSPRRRRFHQTAAPSRRAEGIRWVQSVFSSHRLLVRCSPATQSVCSLAASWARGQSIRGGHFRTDGGCYCDWSGLKMIEHSKLGHMMKLTKREKKKKSYFQFRPRPTIWVSFDPCIAVKTLQADLNKLRY